MQYIRRLQVFDCQLCILTPSPLFCVPALPLGGTVDVLATDDPDVAQEEEQELQVYEKHNHLLHGNRKQR